MNIACYVHVGWAKSGDHVGLPGAADEDGGDGDGGEGGGAAYPKGQVEAAGERGCGAVAVVDQRVEAGGRDGGGDGHSDRSAEILRGVEQAGGDSRVAFGDPGQRADGDRDEGERGADAGDEERPGQVAP